MNEVTARAWLIQEIRDLLGEGPVGLYEFLWGLNGTSYGLSRDAAVELSRQVARDFVSNGQAEIFLVRWPGFELVDGPLPIQALDDPDVWSEGTSGPMTALVPAGHDG